MGTAGLLCVALAVTAADGAWHVESPAPGHPRKARVLRADGTAVSVAEGLADAAHPERLGDRVRAAESVLGDWAAWAARFGLGGLAGGLVVAGGSVGAVGAVLLLVREARWQRPVGLGPDADFLVEQSPGWMAGGAVAVATGVVMFLAVLATDVYHSVRGPRPPDPRVLEETARSDLWDPAEAEHVVTDHNARLRGAR